MRILLVSIGFVAALVAFGSPFLSHITPQTSAAAHEGGSAGFPKPGIYDIVTQLADGREETAMWVDASNRISFEELVARDRSNCRNRNVTIGGGSFDVTMTCDAPDGDINNIRTERRGSYSENSIEITSDTYLSDRPIRWVTRYRLRDS